jgi:hypothetical protein
MIENKTESFDVEPLALVKVTTNVCLLAME